MHPHILLVTAFDPAAVEKLRPIGEVVLWDGWDQGRRTDAVAVCDAAGEATLSRGDNRQLAI